MNFVFKGKAALIFARIWGVVAMLFGLFIILFNIYSVFMSQASVESNLIRVLAIVFGAGFILLGRFFLSTKMSSPHEQK